MNLPNKLSILRVFCIPVLVILLLLTAPWCRYAAAAVFLIASVTDYLDGHIARKHGLITDFGKFIDPVADKLLVLSTLIMLIHTGQMPAWVPVIILARELCVDGLRMVAVTKGNVIAAGPLGKIKTASQMVLILYLLIFGVSFSGDLIAKILTGWVVLMTILSGVDYFRKNLSVFETK